MRNVQFCINECSPRMEFIDGQWVCPTCGCVMVVREISINPDDVVEP